MSLIRDNAADVFLSFYPDRFIDQVVSEFHCKHALNIDLRICIGHRIMCIIKFMDKLGTDGAGF